MVTLPVSATAPDVGQFPQLSSPLADGALQPLNQPQLYELIAARLIEWIGSGRLAEGDRLPPERELAVGLEVSRSSVREAIGALNVEGLVETRAGSGSFVAAGARDRAYEIAARPPSGAPGAADASPFAVLQAREVLEPGIVRAAAERATGSAHAEDLLAMMEQIDIEDPAQRDRWSDADRLFHRELAVIGGNPVLLALADQISALMDQPLWRRLRDDMIRAPGRVAIHIAEHRLIYQGVVEGEADVAAAQSLHHVERVRRQMTD
jgi:DNA-binding FadR family transcriptional regulator